MGVLILLFLILMDHFSVTTALAAKINQRNANSPPPPRAPPPSLSRIAASKIAAFKPGIAIIVGVLTTIFLFTFLLLLYVKHCKMSVYGTNYSNGPDLTRGNSGIHKKVIESLPMFRFASLRGQKDGLECAVCLNRFEPEEVLRLLPKCKHAFHIECVDTWLDEHSTCPLCRYRVAPEDVLLVDPFGSSRKNLYNHINHSDHHNQPTPRKSEIGVEKESPSPRYSRLFSGRRHSSAGARGSNSLEIIVENSRNNNDSGRRRVSVDTGSSRGKSTSRNLSRKSSDNYRQSSVNSGRRDGKLPVQGEIDKHRLEHRIEISGDGEAVAEEKHQRRWSDVQAMDVLYLRWELLLGGEEGGSSGGEVRNVRSVSEIRGMSRFMSDSGGRERREEEEAVVKRWSEWFSHADHHRQKPPVNSDIASSSSSAIV